MSTSDDAVVKSKLPMRWTLRQARLAATCGEMSFSHASDLPAFGDSRPPSVRTAVACTSTTRTSSGRRENSRICFCKKSME
jgi:hypothetical protein